VLPFASKNVRSATFGRGTIFSPARGLGPIEPFSTRWGRIGTMGREFLTPTSEVTRVTPVTTEDSLGSIRTSQTINPTEGQTGLKGTLEGSQQGSWHTPWRASQLRRWGRWMTGRPFRGAYVEFDVAPGELSRPGGKVKKFFGRWQGRFPAVRSTSPDATRRSASSATCRLPRC
jgi:hypothetical protein